MASGVTVADRSWQLMESARHGSASPSSHSLDTAFDEVCRIPPEESASRHVASRLRCLCLADGLKYSDHGPNTDAHLTGDSLDREPCFTKPHDFIDVEDPTRRPIGSPIPVPCFLAAFLGRAMA
jgi:hypothetical protein